MEERNLSLLTDMYQLTMAQGYFKMGMHNKQATFNMFYRKNPFGNGYAVFAGLEQVVEYLQNFKLTDNDTKYLKLNGFDKDFIEYLFYMKMNLHLQSVKEGSVVFPYEPLVQVSGDMAQGQILETPLLTTVNHQTLIATKASRIVQAACGRKSSEFGLRRAQGYDGGIYGARASYIAGFASTSNVYAGIKFGIPVSGTMAHSWVMSFPTELDSFRAYAKQWPNNCILLVDTYDTLQSGVPNAIKVFKEMMESGLIGQDYDYEGCKAKKMPLFGIRIDSGDLAYLTKKAWEMLLHAGFPHAVIVVSNDLDETTIESLIAQGAKIHVLGVGTKNIVADGCPALGGVYKLVELEGEPKIKVSENIEKITNPGKKTFHRLLDNKGKIIADYIGLAEKFGSDTLSFTKDLTLMDETHSWKQITLKAGEYKAREMLETVMYNGNLVRPNPTLEEIKAYCEKEKQTLWDEQLRLVNPAKVKVDISDDLYDVKKKLLHRAKAQA